MRWRWPFRKDRPSSLTPPPSEGRQAKEATLDRIAEVDNRWPEVNAVASALRKQRVENHFSDQIANLFSGKEPR